MPRPTEDDAAAGAALVATLRRIVREEIAAALASFVPPTGPARVAERDVMNIVEAARYLRISKDYLYRKSADGSIPHVKLGNRTVFLRESLDRWLREREHERGR